MRMAKPANVLGVFVARLGSSAASGRGFSVWRQDSHIQSIHEIPAAVVMVADSGGAQVHSVGHIVGGATSVVDAGGADGAGAVSGATASTQTANRGAAATRFGGCSPPSWA